jgi:hypothetical protein
MNRAEYDVWEAEQNDYALEHAQELITNFYEDSIVHVKYTSEDSKEIQLYRMHKIFIILLENEIFLDYKVNKKKGKTITTMQLIDNHNYTGSDDDSDDSDDDPQE